jgi:Uma2 family endonuclease
MRIKIEYHQFTNTDVDQLVAVGILAEDEHIELIQGQLIKRDLLGILHAACVDRLNKLFSRQVADDIVISVQNPMTINEILQPEPDVMLLAPRADFYTKARPTARDVLLLVEVSDSSLAYDQEIKLPLYARAGVREVWLVNLPEQSIDCYSHPTAQDYRLCERFFAGDTIQPDVMPNVTVDVGFVLNPLAPTPSSNQ